MFNTCTVVLDGMGGVLSERGKKDKLILYLQNIQSEYWELYSETNSCGSPRWGTSRKQWRGNLDRDTEMFYTHPHKSKTNTGRMQLYDVYSSKLRYQLLTDVSDSAVRVRHSQQEPTGMNKLHAGNDWKYIFQ